MAFKNREDEREYQRNYREENNAKLLADARTRAAARYEVPQNKQHRLATQKAARDADPNKFRQRTHKSRLKHSARVMVSDARHRAVRKGVPFALNRAETDKLQAIVDAGVCEISGLPFATGARFRDPRSPSIDRIKPELGYVSGNVRIVLWALNVGMATWGFDEYLTVARAIVDRNPQPVIQEAACAISPS